MRALVCAGSGSSANGSTTGGNGSVDELTGLIAVAKVYFSNAIAPIFGVQVSIIGDKLPTA